MVSLSCLSTWATWTALWSPSSTAGRVSWVRAPWSWSWSSTSWRSSPRSRTHPTNLEHLELHLLNLFFFFPYLLTSFHSLVVLPSVISLSTVCTSKEPGNCAVPGGVAFLKSNLCIQPPVFFCSGEVARGPRKLRVGASVMWHLSPHLSGVPITLGLSWYPHCTANEVTCPSFCSD